MKLILSWVLDNKGGETVLILESNCYQYKYTIKLYLLSVF